MEPESFVGEQPVVVDDEGRVSHSPGGAIRPVEVDDEGREVGGARTAKYGPYSQIPPEIPPRGLKTKYDSE